MLEEFGRGRNWLTGRWKVPLGPGVNFQVSVQALAPILGSLTRAGWPLFMAPEERWYQAGAVEKGVHQFLVQDPDGYLVRFAAQFGDRRRGPSSRSPLPCALRLLKLGQKSLLADDTHPHGSSSVADELYQFSILPAECISSDKTPDSPPRWLQHALRTTQLHVIIIAWCAHRSNLTTQRQSACRSSRRSVAFL